MVPVESQDSVSTQSFWNQGTTTMVDVWIFNLESDSYLSTMTEKAQENVEKKKKEKTPQDCLEHKRNFTPLVYSSGRIPGTKALASKRRLTPHISFKLKWE